MVLVCYHPQPDDVEAITALASTYKGVIVDNSECVHFTGSKVGRMSYLPQYENRGIAEAQNQAVERLLQDEEVEYIIFLDQDSRTEPDFPIRMMEAYEQLASHRKLALLGPRIVDKRSGEHTSSTLHREKKNADGFIPMRDVISSGSVVPVSVMKTVGRMRASMFIDYVDFEWCWRAEKMGYVCGITDTVTLRHKVGEREIRIGRYTIQVWSAFRYFYQYRNYLWLCRLAYVPTQWKLATGVKLLARMVYFPLLVSGGREMVREMVRGVRASMRDYAQFEKEIEGHEG